MSLDYEEEREMGKTDDWHRVDPVDGKADAAMPCAGWRGHFLPCTHPPPPPRLLSTHRANWIGQLDLLLYIGKCFLLYNYYNYTEEQALLRDSSISFHRIWLEGSLLISFLSPYFFFTPPPVSGVSPNRQEIRIRQSRRIDSVHPDRRFCSLSPDYQLWRHIQNAEIRCQLKQFFFSPQSDM